MGPDFCRVIMRHSKDETQAEIDRLTGEYNAAVANGLGYKARRIDRRIKSLERGRRVNGFDLQAGVKLIKENDI